jgi:hypothetical protein
MSTYIIIYDFNDKLYIFIFNIYKRIKIRSKTNFAKELLPLRLNVTLN